MGRKQTTAFVRGRKSLGTSTAAGKEIGSGFGQDGVPLRFHELNKAIPKGALGDKHEHEIVLATGDDWAVRVRFPGKYGPDDYVVEVSDDTMGWKYKQIRHNHLFYDFEEKMNADAAWTAWVLLPRLLRIVRGEHPPAANPTPDHIPGVQVAPLEYATQALAVCEYRRFPQGDKKGGGRYLPINFVMAIALGKWTAAEASAKMRFGRPPLERLGFPLFNTTTKFETYEKEVLYG